MRIRRGCLVALVLALVVDAALPVSAQAVLTAQIETFWTQISTATNSRFFTNLGLLTNGYVTFGSTTGTTGYGFRDAAGTMQFKNANGNWATFAGGGPSTTVPFWIATADATAPNASVLGALGTGLVLNATTTGVPSIYAGTTCTNQFPRSLSASGVATCASVALGTDVSGTLAAAQFPALTGDITTAGGALATTLAATAVTPAAYGSATAIPTFTVDQKGRLTAAGTATPQLTLTSTYFSSLSGAALTGLPTTAFTGQLQATQFPVLTGDVTTSGGSLATTVGTLGGKTVTLGGTFITSGASSLTLTTTGATSLTLPTSGTLISSTVTALASLATVGTIGTGVWQGTVVGATYGGTGVNNGASTITLGGSLTTSGAFGSTFTMTNTTAVTFPTSGTLVSTAAPSRGDMIAANVSAVYARVALGAGGTLWRSDGTDPAWSATVPAGTITSSTPWTWTQTWNAIGVAFHAFDVTVTDTASAAGSTGFRVLGGAGGATTEFSIDKNGAGVLASTLTTTGLLSATAGSGTLGSTALPFASAILGTAATNNLTITPAAFAQGTVATVDDPGLAAVKLPTVRRGTISYTAGSLSAGTCSAAVTSAVTGLATTAVITASHNALPGTQWQKGIYFLAYPTANTVNIIVCNPTAGSITPDNATFNYAAIVP